MSSGTTLLRAGFALLAALFVATASVAGPIAELTEEMHHAAAHSGGDAKAQDAYAPESDDPGHQHPDTPGHTHCGAACHVQVADARLAVNVVYTVTRTSFVAFGDHYLPAGHLDNLFRPPRA